MSDKRFSIKFSLDEIKTLLALAEGQMFREKFIDPKFPGHKGHSPEHGLSAVKLLREVLIEAKEIPDRTVNTSQGGTPTTHG